MDAPEGASAGELGLDVEQPHPGVLLISVSGEVDETNVGRLADFLDSRLATGPDAIALDLTRVGFLGVPGLDVLRSAQHRAVDVHLVVTNREVLRALRTAGLTEVFTVHASAQSAVAKLSRQDG